MTPSSPRESSNGRLDTPPVAPQKPRDRWPSVATLGFCFSGLIVAPHLLDFGGQSLGYDIDTTLFLVLHIALWTMLLLVPLFALWRFVWLFRRAARRMDDSGPQSEQGADQPADPSHGQSTSPAESTPPGPPPRSRGVVTLGFGLTAFGSLAAALYSVVHLLGWAPEPSVPGRADQSLAPILTTLLFSGIASTFVLFGFITIHGGKAGGLARLLRGEIDPSSGPVTLDAMLAHRFLRAARLTRRLCIACLTVSWGTILVSLRLTALDQAIVAGWRHLESPFTVARIGTLLGTPALMLLAFIQGAMWLFLSEWRRAGEGHQWRLRDLEAANRPRFL